MEDGWMKRIKPIIGILFLFFILQTGLVFAQVEEELEEPDQSVMEDVKCQMDSMVSGYELAYRNDPSLKENMAYLQAISLGNEYFKQKNYLQAIPYFWKYIAADTKDQYYKTVMKKLIESYYNLGIAEKGEQAVAYLDTSLMVCYRGLQDDPDYVTYHYWAGLIQSLLRRYKCAIPHYEKLVELQPGEKAYVETLAGLYFAVGDSRAIDMQQKVVELDPNDQEARQKLEVFTRKLGGDLFEVYEKNYKANPDNPDFARSYADAALKGDKLDIAITVYQKLLKLKPEEKETLNKLGKAYHLKGDFNNAIKYYKLYSNHASSDPAVYTNIAECYAELKSFSNAISFADKALRIKPGYGPAYMVKGKTFMYAVNECSSKREKAGLTYDDKLVYKLAYDMFKQAEKDYATASQARNYINSLQSVIPTKEDYFLHKNRTEIRDNCYSWIGK